MQLSTNDNTIFFQVKKLPVNWPAKVYILRAMHTIRYITNYIAQE